MLKRNLTKQHQNVTLCLLVKGMGIIEQLDPMSFTNYLKKYRNTICGRHPIGVLLNVSITEEQPHRVFHCLTSCR